MMSLVLRLNTPRKKHGQNVVLFLLSTGEALATVVSELTCCNLYFKQETSVTLTKIITSMSRIV